MKLVIILLTLCIIWISWNYPNNLGKNNHKKSQNIIIDKMILDSGTVLKIADAIWTSHYGPNAVEIRKQVSVSLIKDSIWAVMRIQSKSNPNSINLDEGSLYLEIQKRDCKILKYKGIFD